MKPVLKHLSLTGAVVMMLAALGHAQNQTASPDTGVISGTVSADSGPLNNARVSVGKMGANVPGQMVRVDSKGSFQTGPLAPGLYYLSAYVPGLIGDPSSSGVRSYYRPGDTVNFKLIKGGVITGSVKNANGDALIAIPVRATMVRNRNGDPVQSTSGGRQVWTDDRGIYRLYGLQPGTYIVSAGGASRLGFGGPYSPSAYEAFVPTYSPSATRDTATELQLNSGDEVQADIQFREERGHVISGTIMGTATSDGPQQFGASTFLYDVHNRFEVASAGASGTSNFSFAMYGVPDGDYELWALQGSSTTDELASPVMRIKVQGADVTGLRLTLAPLASIEGRVTFENDPKPSCGKPRATALVETMVYSRRFDPPARTKEASTSDVPLSYRNTARSSMLDARGGFTLKNLQPGTYQMEATPLSPGWYLRSVGPERPAAAAANASRDLLLKRGDHVTGLLITFGEGAAKLDGHLSAAEGQALPSKMRVYLVPSEREAVTNIYRFYEAVADQSGIFKFENVAPGKYLIVSRRAEVNESGLVKAVRQDEALRARVREEAQAQNQPVTLKPCEQVGDFNLQAPSVPR